MIQQFISAVSIPKQVVIDTARFFIHDWKHNKTLFWVEAVSTIAAMFASMLMALTIPHPPFVVVYSGFLVASTSGMVNAHMRKSGFWLGLNFYFTIANSIALLAAL